MKVNQISRTEAEAAELLRKIEMEGGLLQLRLLGYNPWRLIRFPVGLALQNLPFYPPQLPIWVLFISFIRSIYDILTIPKNSRYAVKSFSSALRIKSKAGYEDIYFEEILQNIPGGLRLYSVNAIGYEGRIRAWKGQHVDVTAILIISSLLARLFPVNDNQKIFKYIELCLESHLQNNKLSSLRIRRIFSSFFWQSRLYCWLIRYANLKCIFAADTGERSLLNAAKQNDCKFIELQHGIFSIHHPDAILADSSLMPDDGGLLLPDLIATYGDYWANEHKITVLGLAGRVRSCGASFMERLRNQRIPRKKKEATQILLTTQGLAREELLIFIREFLTECAVPIILYIKLHPAYDPFVLRYQEVLGHDKRVTIISGNSDPDTHSLLSECDLHISISSACHYDAIGLEIPTIVLALPNYEIVLDLVNTGAAIIAKDGKELAGIVNSRKWQSVPKELSKHYYKTGFVSNIIEWVDHK